MLIVKELCPFIFLGGQEWDIKEVSPDEAQELVHVGFKVPEGPPRQIPIDEIRRIAETEGALIELGKPGNAHYLFVSLKDKKPDISKYKGLCPECGLREVKVIVGTDLMRN